MPTAEGINVNIVARAEQIGEQTFADARAVAEEVRDYAFTFGWDHVWPLTGTKLNKSYVKLRGTLDGTRDEMNRRFGSNWSMQYRFDAKFEQQIERFELSELQLEFPDNKAVFE